MTQQPDPTSLPPVRKDVLDLLESFAYLHLPTPALRDISARFHRLAHEVVGLVDDGRELLKALDHLLAAKDAAVRAALRTPPPAATSTSGWCAPADSGIGGVPAPATTTASGTMTWTAPTQAAATPLSNVTIPGLPSLPQDAA